MRHLKTFNEKASESENKKFKKGDIVLIKKDNLIKAGYLRTEEKKSLTDNKFIISHISKGNSLHYYKQSLIDAGLYSEEELQDKEVYTVITIGIPDGYKSQVAIATIDDDLILLEESEDIYKSIKNSEKRIINKMLIAYIRFHYDFDLDGNTGNIEQKISNNSKLNKRDLKLLINIIDNVNSLPCIDPLYDKYMDEEVNNWLNDNEDFYLPDYIKYLLD